MIRYYALIRIWPIFGMDFVVYAAESDDGIREANRRMERLKDDYCFIFREITLEFARKLTDEVVLLDLQAAYGCTVPEQFGTREFYDFELEQVEDGLKGGEKKC